MGEHIGRTIPLIRARWSDLCRWISAGATQTVTKTRTWKLGNTYLVYSALSIVLAAPSLAFAFRYSEALPENQILLVVAFACAYAFIDWRMIEFDTRHDQSIISFGGATIIAAAFHLTPIAMTAMVILAWSIRTLLSGYSIQAGVSNMTGGLLMASLPTAAIAAFSQVPDAHNGAQLVAVGGAWFIAGRACDVLMSIAMYREATGSYRNLRSDLQGLARRLLYSSTGDAVAIIITISVTILIQLSVWTLLLTGPLVLMALAGVQRFSRPRRDAKIFKMLFELTQQIQEISNRETSIELLLRALIEDGGASYVELILDEGEGVRSTSMSEDRPLANTVRSESADELVAITELLATRRGLEKSDAPQYLSSRFDDHSLSVLIGAALPNAAGRNGALLLGSKLKSFGIFMKSEPEALGIFANAAAAALHIDDLATSIERLDAEHERAWQEATHDPLTGVANRRLFSERLQHALRRREPRLAVLYVDVDDLKTINDKLGHNVGDELIKGAAQHFATKVRAHDTVARLGGDEFAVILENITEADARSLAGRLIDSFELTFDGPDGSITAAASGGLAYAHPGSSIESLLEEADQNLYRSKRNQKGHMTTSATHAE